MNAASVNSDTSKAEKIRTSEFVHQWVEDILYFEGPILSLLKASTTQDFFYYWCGVRNKGNRWLAVEVTREDIEEYKGKEVTLLELIQSKDYAYLVTIGEDKEIRSVFKTGVDELAEDCLPPTESYFDTELCPTEQDKLLESPGEYSINLDGNWFLGDLVEIPRVYNQLYSFIYTLRHLYKSSVESNASDIFSRYPWRGGFSAVHFYSQLNRVIPSLHEPKIRAINYASPGEIRLELHVDASVGVRNSINSVAKNLNRLAELNKEVQALVRAEGLSRVEGNVSQLRLSRQAKKFLKEKATEIGREMGLKDYVPEIQRMAGNDLLAVKILLSFYRRIIKFSEFQNRGMISFD